MAVDVAIIGGGPAGTAAALTLLKYSELSVAVVERSNYKEWRVGESLSPGAADLLRYLGAWETFTARGHLPSYGTCAAWGSPEILARDFLFTGRGTAWHLDRREFDQTLAGLVSERGGLLMTEAVVEREMRDPKGWRLWVRCGKSPGRMELRARFVIDASGKQAVFARRNGGRRKIGDRLVGIVGLYSFSEQKPRDSFTVVEANSMGWWYSANLPEGWTALAFMSDSDLIRRHGWHRREPWLELLACTRHVRPGLERGVMESRPVICPAYSQILQPIAGDGWVAAGESAAGFDPLSSMGIGYALTSGIEAARVVHNVLTGDGRQMASYTASVARHYAEYRTRQRQYYLMEQRWPDSLFWVRRHSGVLHDASTNRCRPSYASSAGAAQSSRRVPRFQR
jgi:flavin-dependent dehydrogenase